MAKKKSKRENVWLECSQCKERNYRTNVSVAEGTPKLSLKKYCKKEQSILPIRYGASNWLLKDVFRCFRRILNIIKES
jgi:ribosomal protein L33